MFSRLVPAGLSICLALAAVRADLTVYSDGALASGWENWSWSSTIDFAATDIFEGTSSISVVSQAWSALSFKLEGVWGGSYQGLKFDISGDNPPIQLYFSSTGDNDNSAQIPLSAFSTTVSSSNWTTIVVNFAGLPPGGTPLANDTWDRINWQALGNGATYHLDNIVFVTEFVIPAEFLSAEPIGNDLIAITTQGPVDLSTVSVKLNNATVAILSNWTYVPVNAPSASITYFQLASPFLQGSLVISAGSAANAITFMYALPAAQTGSLHPGTGRQISPLIYGVNFPADAKTVKDLGVTISRWGGNAVTAYNPYGGFTNAGADWYFENRASDSAADWVTWVTAAGSDTMLVVPSLDWVAKDNSSYSYPKSIYPNQSAFDIYEPDAGSGLFPNGSVVTPAPPQSRAYSPWNTARAGKWLYSLPTKPFMVLVDNEIEIASSTHSDMHPAPMDYDEELARIVATATIAKSEIPGVLVGAPSVCGWWFYWTLAYGYGDYATHNNTDWLPWFLQQMNAKSAAAGKRLLDYLDIHYYYAPDTSAGDAAATALRLRMTRSLWDPTYIDESWIGSYPQNHQPNPTAVWLIPRMQSLIAQYYPGTKLSISEWSANGDTDLIGGLVAADVLGIYGLYGVDAATYWGTVDDSGPIGLGFWLYRGGGTYFGDVTIPVNVTTAGYQNLLGVYGATNSHKKTSLVIINKDVKPQALSLTNVPTGQYFLRHFGGTSGMYKWQSNITLKASNYLVVPSHAAIFLQEY